MTKPACRICDTCQENVLWLTLFIGFLFLFFICFTFYQLGYCAGDPECHRPNIEDPS